MITQRCPKCRSNRIRRGYRHTSIFSKVVFRYNLLCDSCNWEFNGFAIPFEIAAPTDSKKQNVQEKVSGGISLTSDLRTAPSTRDGQLQAGPNSDIEPDPDRTAVDTVSVKEAKSASSKATTVPANKHQKSKRSKRRSEKLAKGPRTAVRSRTSNDNVATKLTRSIGPEDPGLGNGTDKPERTNVRSRVIASKRKTVVGKSNAPEELQPAGGPRKQSIKPRIARVDSGQAVKAKKARKPVSGSAAQVSESATAGRKITKVIRNTVKKKPSVTKAARNSTVKSL